ncbi:myomesin-3-like [Notothenia coriiceps]|uniref:Myomesin-3-like n=1 Tax=Notothenia coriiceps TaxID=8208 RepID=A0A6I9MLP8_9TELE|nr:PREDICTED: myomesin-3-like [Notothenia coriiceps]
MDAGPGSADNGKRSHPPRWNGEPGRPGCSSALLSPPRFSSLRHRKITFDRASGLVEVLFDQLSAEDEGSYTAQLKDGRAKNQFTLVFVDEKFRETLALVQKNRRDHKRKSGPYFEEDLSWSVNEDCELVIKCKVTNTHKDTSVKWFKEGVAVTRVVYDQSSGVSTLTIPQVTKKEAGSYRAVVTDGRGEDVSTLELLDDEYDKLLQQLSKQCETPREWHCLGHILVPQTLEAEVVGIGTRYLSQGTKDRPGSLEVATP